MKILIDEIDRLIDDRFMPKKCMRRGRSRCQCGHHDGVHQKESDRSRGTGKCYGGHRQCICLKFVPYDYKKEADKLRDKLREFAFAVRRLDGG